MTPNGSHRPAVGVETAKGPVLIEPQRFEDSRGWFCESYSSARLSRAGITCDFPQDNQSWSRDRGTVRGLHFQRPPSAQAKLISCLRGKILDCVVDLRLGSPTFGDALTIELDSAGLQLFVPVGFAHGFVTLTPDVLVSYKVSHAYDADADDGVAWNDPDIGIRWPVSAAAAILSEKDARLQRLAALKSPFVYDGFPMALTRI